MDVSVYVNDALETDLTVKTIRASYVRPWQAELQWTGRHDDPPSVQLWDDVRIDDAGGTVRFRGNVTEIRPGGVDEEGIVYVASDRRFRLENEPVRINGRGFYTWNRRGYACTYGWGGEDSPGRDGGKWTAGEIVLDILEHALGLPGAGSDIPGHHTTDCCVPDAYLTAADVAGYDAATILSLDSVVGEFSVNATTVAFAITELLALNGGFWGWYLDPDTSGLVVQDLDGLAVTGLEAGRLGHWQDEAGTDYVLLGNDLEWSLDGVCSTIVIQGQDATAEVQPADIEDSGNPAQNGGGQLERVNAPWRAWPAAYRARCQPYRLPTGKFIDLIGTYTPPAGWGGATHLPRVYRGFPGGAKWAYYPPSGAHPWWLLATGMIVFHEVPALAVGERLWGWYWSKQPFTVSAGPDGDAYHWYGYERTRWVYDTAFRSVSTWPDPGTSDDAVAMGVLAERLLRIFRDVRRQGTLRCDEVDFGAYSLDRRYNLRNLGPEHLPCPAPTTDAPATTTEMGGYSDPVAWRSLRINAVDVLYDFEADAVEITVANTFWMLEEYSAIKQRLEMNLFAQRELALSQDIYDCQVSSPVIDDQPTMEPATTTKPATTTGEPPTTGEPTTTPEPPTTTTEGPTTTQEPGSTTTVLPTCPPFPDPCAHCEETYYVDDIVVECEYYEDCDSDMMLEQEIVGDDDIHLCEWRGAGGYEGGPCTGRIHCSSSGGDAVWFLHITHMPTGDSAVYTRPAHSTDCPAGVYSFAGSGGGFCTFPTGELRVY